MKTYRYDQIIKYNYMEIMRSNKNKWELVSNSKKAYGLKKSGSPFQDFQF